MGATRGGDIDPDLVNGFITSNLSGISYCYDKELAANPGLSGLVKATFLIVSTGGVQAARADGVDAAVSSCVAAVIKRIPFSAPYGGGGAQVNCRFTFAPPRR